MFLLSRVPHADFEFITSQLAPNYGGQSDPSSYWRRVLHERRGQTQLSSSFQEGFTLR